MLQTEDEYWDQADEVMLFYVHAVSIISGLEAENAPPALSSL